MIFLQHLYQLYCNVHIQFIKPEKTKSTTIAIIIKPPGHNKVRKPFLPVLIL
jgi:hypothetical protein